MQNSQRYLTKEEVSFYSLIAEHYAQRLADTQKDTPCYYFLRNSCNFYQRILSTKRI